MSFFLFSFFVFVFCIKERIDLHIEREGGGATTRTPRDGTFFFLQRTFFKFLFKFFDISVTVQLSKKNFLLKFQKKFVKFFFKFLGFSGTRGRG